MVGVQDDFAVALDLVRRHLVANKGSYDGEFLDPGMPGNNQGIIRGCKTNWQSLRACAN
jgi:hypothetical protein